MAPVLGSHMILNGSTSLVLRTVDLMRPPMDMGYNAKTPSNYHKHMILTFKIWSIQIHLQAIVQPTFLFCNYEVCSWITKTWSGLKIKKSSTAIYLLEGHKVNTSLYCQTQTCKWAGTTWLGLRSVLIGVDLGYYGKWASNGSIICKWNGLHQYLLSTKSPGQVAYTSLISQTLVGLNSC